MTEPEVAADWLDEFRERWGVSITEELMNRFEDALTLAFSPVNGGCGCDPAMVCLHAHLWGEACVRGLSRYVTVTAVEGLDARALAALLLDQHLFTAHEGVR